MSRPPDPKLRVTLLRAAEAVFVERGLDRAKVEEITARAGCSKGAFYLHFAGKEDAFRQIVETVLARLADQVEAFPDNETLPADGSLVAWLERWIAAETEIFEFLWQNRGVVRLCFQGGRSAQFGYLIDEFAELSRARLLKTLERLVEAGLYRADLDLEVVSVAIAGAYDRVARHLLRMPSKPDFRRWLAGLSRLVQCGVAMPGLAAACACWCDGMSDQRVTATRPAASGMEETGRAPTKPARRSKVVAGGSEKKHASR